MLSPGNVPDQDPSIDWSAQDWEDFIPRLLRLAARRLSLLAWQNVEIDDRSGSYQPEDFVNDAVEKTISGVRKWRPSRCTLFEHLAGVVASSISHAAEAHGRHFTLVVENTFLRPESEISTPSQELISLWRSEQRQIIKHLRDTDPFLGKMAELILTRDIQESSELSRELGISRDSVANLRKRLRRACDSYLKGER